MYLSLYPLLPPPLLVTCLLQLYTLMAGLVVLLFTVRRRFIWRVFFLSLWVCLSINIGSYLLGPVIIPIVAAMFASGCVVALYHHVLCEPGEEEGHLPRTSSASSPAHSLEEGITARLAGSVKQLGSGPAPTTTPTQQQQGRSDLQVVVHQGAEDKAIDEKEEEKEEEEEGEKEGRGRPRSKSDTEQGAKGGLQLGLIPEEKPLAQGQLHYRTSQYLPVTYGPEGHGPHANAPGPHCDKGRVSPHFDEKGRASPHIHVRGVEEVDFGRVHRKSPHAESHHHSNLVFVALFSVCTVVVFWLHPFLFYALIPSCAWLVVKYLCSGLMLPRTVSFLSGVASFVRTWVDYVMPLPLSSLTHLFFSFDRLCAYIVKASLGSLVSVNIIAGLVLVVVCGVLLLGFQTQVELRHFGSVVMSIWNSTVSIHPHLSQ